jgi:hypothetical protein
MKPMTSLRPCLAALAAIVALGLCEPAIADPAFSLSGGGTFSFRGDFNLAADSPPGAADGLVVLSPIVKAGIGPIEARLEGRATIEPGARPGFELGETWIKFFPFDILAVQVGRFAVRPGNALFLTNLSLFGQADPLSALETGEAALSDQLEFTYLGSSVHARLDWAPPFLTPSFIAPNATDPYFPALSLPSEIDILGTIAKRSGIVFLPVIDEAYGQQAYGDFLAELGASVGAFELSVVGFSGLSRDAVFLPLLNFGYDFSGGSFSIDITPRRSWARALGGSLSFIPEPTRWGAFELHLETLYTWDKLTLIDTSAIPRLSIRNSLCSILVASAGSSDDIAATAGTSWSFPLFPLTIFIEGRILRYLDAPATTVDPFLATLGLGGLRASFFDGRLNCLLLGARDFDGGGWLVAARIDAALFGESSLSVQVPVFFGAANTPLGQFSGKERLSLVFEARF